MTMRSVEKERKKRKRKMPKRIMIDYIRKGESGRPEREEYFVRIIIGL